MAEQAQVLWLVLGAHEPVPPQLRDVAGGAIRYDDPGGRERRAAVLLRQAGGDRLGGRGQISSSGRETDAAGQTLRRGRPECSKRQNTRCGGIDVTHQLISMSPHRGHFL